MTKKSGKSKIVAAILAIIFGSFGLHKFYLGQVLWGLIDEYILHLMERLVSPGDIQRVTSSMTEFRSSGLLGTLADAQVIEGEPRFCVEAFVPNRAGELKSRLFGLVVEKDTVGDRVLVETDVKSALRPQALRKVRMWLPASTPAAEWSNPVLP